MNKEDVAAMIMAELLPHALKELQPFYSAEGRVNAAARLAVFAAERLVDAAILQRDKPDSVARHVTEAWDRDL